MQPRLFVKKGAGVFFLRNPANPKVYLKQPLSRMAHQNPKSYMKQITPCTMQKQVQGAFWSASTLTNEVNVSIRLCEALLSVRIPFHNRFHRGLLSRNPLDLMIRAYVKYFHPCYINQHGALDCFDPSLRYGRRGGRPRRCNPPAPSACTDRFHACRACCGWSAQRSGCPCSSRGGSGPLDEPHAVPDRQGEAGVDA